MQEYVNLRARNRFCYQTSSRNSARFMKQMTQLEIIFIQTAQVIKY
jgi:hypothetical protein